MRIVRHLALAAATLLLGGCATLSPDSAPTDADRARTADFIRERLATALSAEDAVAIALVNNPALQAAYAELRIAESELVQAGRLRNPGFSYARLKRGAEREIERSFTIDVVGLVTMPLRLEAERGMFAGAQARTALEVARVGDEARRAWVDAVAAAQGATYAAQVNDAAAAGSELARQMGRAGNFNRLARSREQLFHAEASANLARSRHAAIAARERLVRALGLWGEDAAALKLPDRLPDPPVGPRELEDAEGLALATRLDVQGARRETEALARALGLTRATRFVNVLHLGYERNSSNEAPRQTGYEVEIEIPLFDWGDAKLARAEAMYLRSAQRIAETAIRARSEVRESHSAYRTAWDLAKHYREEIVPLRKAISDENLLRYNGMLIGVFELLADARDQVGAVVAAIEATRDFWIADANLEMALMTGSPGAASTMKSARPAASQAAGH